MSKVYWRMKNGQMIDIDLMDVNHLRNVLKMIIRNSQKIQKPKSEVKLNGDIAQSFNNDMDLWDMEMKPGITDIETGIL